MLLFPAVLAVGIILIPVVTNYADHVLASEAVEHTARWFLGHLLSAVAFGLSLISSSEVVAHLRQNPMRRHRSYSHAWRSEPAAMPRDRERMGSAP